MNDLQEIWKKLDKQGKNDLAEKLDTSYAYLSQLANGYRKPGKHFKKALAGELAMLASQK